jgi:hypothetical protein
LVYTTTPDQWKAAKKRAKFMELHLIKDKANFDAILDCFLPTPDMDKFIHVCDTIGLDGSEINWLWTYLKNGNMALYWSVSEHNDIPDSEVASTGW